MNSNKNLLIANNNFAPNIYIQTPIINIDKKIAKKGKFPFSKKDINNSKKLKRLQILSNKNNIYIFILKFNTLFIIILRKIKLFIYSIYYFIHYFKSK